MRRDHRQRLTIAIGAIVCAALGQLARAADFHLTIGNPIAALAPAPASRPGGPMNKKLTNAAVFVVRIDDCADPSQAGIEGTVEGLVGSIRRSERLLLNAMPTAGVFAVNRTWPTDGAWVANLVGTCRNLKAGAIVPIALASNGFLRESITFYSPATAAEVDAALKAHAAT